MGAPQARNSWLLYMAVRKFTADGKDSHRNDHAADHPGDWLADADGEVAEAGTSQRAKITFPMSSRQLQKSGIPGRRIPLKDISQDDQDSHGRDHRDSDP